MTLFPEMCESVLNEGVIGRARRSGAALINCRNVRDYSLDKHKRVDDAPYGGGTGMIMQAQPIYDCFRALCEETGERPRLIYMSPQGKVLTQERVKELARLERVALLCGRYEGVDQRVIDEIVDEEISIGDYVLTGGELPALILADAVARMLPGVLANEEAFTLESHYSGLLEHPQYTRPFEWRGRTVPETLISGRHADVEKWKREKRLERTFASRPDMLEKALLTKRDAEYIEKLKNAGA